MRLTHAKIEVHPPRAARRSLSLPNGYWRIRRWFSNHMSSALAEFGQPFYDDLAYGWGTGLRLRAVIPGLPQYFNGSPYRGHGFFWGFLALMVPAVVLAGTGVGALLLGLAFGIHFASAVDLGRKGMTTISHRPMRYAYAALALGLFLYGPVGWLLTRVATPFQITAVVGEFQAGDVLWYNRSADPKVGDMVLYEIPAVTIPGRTAGGYNANYRIAGMWVNRILAREGQSVELKDGQLFVDSQTQIDLPIACEMTNLTYHSYTFSVPSEHVLLVPPVNAMPVGGSISPQSMQMMCVVPRANVRGRVFFRTLPFSRISRIP